MRLVLGSVMALALSAGAVLAGGHSSGPKIYAVHSKHNFCPAGLQPVTMDGTICCGRPNQSMSYQQVMAHPQRAAKRHYRSARVSCPAGEKGCK